LACSGRPWADRILDKIRVREASDSRLPKGGLEDMGINSYSMAQGLFGGEVR
jgi:serine/threonine protein kinase HipA of HipAB toxin-antitoxin module